MKYLVYILVAIAGLMGVKLYLNSRKGNSENKAIALDYDAQVSNISYEESQIVADMQHDAMSEMFTDFSTIVDTLDNLNGEALKMVFNAFGNRKYLWFGQATYIGIDQNLFSWYQDELNENELLRIRSIWAMSDLNISF